MDKIPIPGWTTKAKVIRVLDGDTVEVEIVRKFKIRMLHHGEYFDTAEKHTEKGQDAKKFLDNLINNKEVTVFIPSKNPIQLLDFNSFNRILGDIWLEDKYITDILLNNGFGKTKK